MTTERRPEKGRYGNQPPLHQSGCPRCGGPSADPPAEVYCAGCATGGRDEYETAVASGRVEGFPSYEEWRWRGIANFPAAAKAPRIFDSSEGTVTSITRSKLKAAVAELKAAVARRRA